MSTPTNETPANHEKERAFRILAGVMGAGELQHHTEQEVSNMLTNNSGGFFDPKYNIQEE